MTNVRAALLSLALLSGCLASPERLPPRVEGTSLLGRELETLQLDRGRLQHYRAKLAQARAKWEADGAEVDAIWVGRHLAYLGRYRDAIEWFTARLEDFPSSVRLRRHRGHRFLSVRELDRAIVDLEDAWEFAAGTPDELEPDGVPNRLGIPRSTTHTNILYHLGLARYVGGEFDEAARVWGECLELCANDDMRAATLSWRLLALRRAGREDEARKLLSSQPRLTDVIENAAYLVLVLEQRRRLAGFGAGIDLTNAERLDASLAYGIGAILWCEGDRDGARALWQRIVDGTPWNAFGHLAAEAELARE